MSKKCLFVSALAVLMIVSTAGLALAVLVQSNHDMVYRYTYTGTNAKQGACSFCHIPHKAQGNRLFPTTINVTGLPSGSWDTDTTAQICWQCHGSVSSYAEAQNVNPFQLDSHDRSYAQLVTWGDVADEPTFEALGVYSIDTAGNLITCASCHNPHDNDKRPFIRDTATNIYTEGNLQSFCVMCHVLRDDNANAGARTNHPTGEALADSAAANIVAFANAPAVMTNAWADLGVTVTATTGGVMTNAWNLGGKFRSGGSQIFDCGTCHAVHHNETANWAAADGGTTAITTPIAALNGALAVMNVDPGVGIVAPICAGCHDIVTDAVAGPGAAGTFSHRYQEQEPWSTNINASGASGVIALYGAKFGGTIGTDGTLGCQSCHDMHFARLANQVVAGSPELARYALMRVSCNECHRTSDIATHHPAGVTVKFGGNGDATNDSVDVDTAPNVSVSTNVAWNTVTRANVISDLRTVRTFGAEVYSFEPVDATHGVMTCGTCHGGGAARAHNSTTSFPQYTGNIAEDGMCVDCHGTNPSNNTQRFTGNKTDNNATHYLGPILTANYRWTYNTGTAVVPLAGAGLIRYGADTAGNGDLICTSCHTLRISGVTPQASNNTNDVEDDTVDAVQLLLTPSGNTTEDTLANQADFLCTACHGANPGATGAQVTHPVMPATTAAASGTVATNANQANNSVTLVNTTNRITCESCHRPHNAATAGGVFIIEQAAAGSGFINETVLCNACHAK